MGTTLTGTTPQDTYDSLIKVTDNGPLSGTAKYLSDGLGNDSVLALSTSKVGIGTASPATSLEVRGASPQFRVGISAGGYVELSDNQVAAKTSAAAAADLYLNVSGANTILNRDSGNVGIGTSAPADKLHVAFDADFSLRIDGAGDIKQYRGDGSTGGLNLETFITSGSWGTNGGFVAISPRGTERVRVTTDGLTFNGDTAAANALDDYEEGTWTMGITFGGGSTGVTYTANTGTYTKIGRKVTVNGYMSLSNKGSSTGTAKITGLPFTIGNSLANYSTANMWYAQVSFANQFEALGAINTTLVELYELTESGTISALNDGNFVNNSEVIISFTYFV